MMIIYGSVNCIRTSMNAFLLGTSQLIQHPLHEYNVKVLEVNKSNQESNFFRRMEHGMKRQQR